MEANAGECIITDYKVRSMLHWSVRGGCHSEKKRGGKYRARKNEMKSK